MTRPRLRVRALCAAITLGTLGSLLSASPSSALDLYKFTGVVKDPVGRVLATSTVTDGTRTATTGADGRYQLGEGSTGTFSLRASKTGLNSKTQQVTVTLPLDTTVDFTLTYQMLANLSISNVSTAGGPRTAVLTAYTYAPNPGTPGTAGSSCVSVADSRTGTTTPAAYQDTQADGKARWTWDLSLPQNTAENAYTLTTVASDCASSTALSSVSALTYKVDNTAPKITGLAPFDGFNTILASQPLQARATDAGGTGLATATLTLTDTATGATQIKPATFGAGGVATSGGAALTDGHVYTLSATVTDGAGNSAVANSLPYPSKTGRSSGFRKIAAPATSASSTIAPVTCAVSGTPGSQIATCPNVALQLGTSTMNVTESQHLRDVAFVTQTAALNAATLSWDVVAGQTQTVNAYDRRRATGNEWNPRSSDYRYDLNGSSFPQTPTGVSVSSSVALGTLVVNVPTEWAAATTVKLAMSSTTTVPATSSTNVCSDPLTPRTTTCSTDPTWNWFAVVTSPTSNIDTIMQQHTALGVEISRNYVMPSGDKVYEAIVPPRAMSAVASTPGVTAVVPGRSDNGDERLAELRLQLAAAPTVAGNALNFVGPNGEQLSIPMAPSTPATITSTAPFEVADGDPMTVEDPPNLDPPATAITDVAQVRPAIAGLAADDTQSAANRGFVRYTGSNIDVEAHALNTGALRIVSMLKNAQAPTVLDFDLTLPAGTELGATKGGAYTIQRSGTENGSVPVGVIPAPYAYDALGRKVNVTQTATSSNIHLVVEPTTGVRYPILVDPTYYPIHCKSVTLNNSAYDYTEVIGDCPYGASFVKAAEYFPVIAQVQGGHNRQVNPVGDGCSGGSVEDTAWFDYNTPCAMHDYCWDLVRVRSPFAYWGVETHPCNDQFFAAMNEHCDSRSLIYAQMCYSTAELYFAGVEADVYAGQAPDHTQTNGDVGNMLTNYQFDGGTAYWGKGTSTTQWLVYNNPGPYLEFNCHGTVGHPSGAYPPGCSVLQDVYSPLHGGESIMSSAQVRCHYTTTTCPMRISTWCYGTSGWLRLSQSSYTISSPNQSQYAYVESEPGATPVSGCGTIRIQIYNDSDYKNLDIRWAGLNVVPA